MGFYSRLLLKKNRKYLKKKRYSIAPQMSEYDKLISDWVPYLMYFNGRSFIGRYVNTDEHGFRKTVSNNGFSLSYEDFESNKKFTKKSIVLGSSTAFGVGATDDKYTITSILNKNSNHLWFNFGGRAIISTQEVILFLLFFPEKLKNIVICSGINNLLISSISKNNSKIFTPFFGQSIYEKAIDSLEKGKSSNKKRLIENFIKIDQYKDQNDRSFSKNEYDDLLCCFSRDMKIISTIANFNRIQVTYFLQPFLPWIKKELSDEEIMLMDINDKLRPNTGKSYSMLCDHESQYTKDIEEICNNYNVNFINLNKSKAFLSNKWLFVDRIHLTNEGYSLASNIIQQKIKL